MFVHKAIPNIGEWILMGIIVSSILLNLFSLNYSPLPWFDEVYFASISRSVATKGKMFLDIYPGIFNNEITTYGPVYFWLQGLIIKASGLNMFTFRLLNFISGLLCLVLLFKLVAKWQPRYAWFFTALLLLDPIYVQNLHSGRMDLLVVVFALAALLFVLNTSLKYSLINPFLVGLLMALAYLTSPRAVFMIAPMLLLILIRKGLKDFLLASICFIVPVAFYITFYYGNIASYWNEFTNNKTLVAHIGPRHIQKIVFRYWHHALVYAGVLAALIWYMTNWKKVRDWSLLFLLTTITLFHLLVVERGPYTAMIAPFYVLCLAALLRHLEHSILKNGVKALCLVTFIVFMSYFTTKQLLIINQLDLRNPKTPIQQLQKMNLQGQKVIASFEYFYAIEKVGAKFIGYEIPVSTRGRINYHLELTGARFMLLSQKDLSAHQFKYYMQQGRVEKVQDLHTESNLPFGLVEQIDFLRPLFTYKPTYEGTLFRIVPK